MNSHQVEGWGSAIRIQLFCHTADIKQQNYLDSVDRLHSSITPNSMAQQLPASTTSHTHPHTSLILYRRSRGACAATDMWQSTSFIEGVVDNSDTHKTSVVTSLD
jgi:hypothetical protein